MSDKYPTVVVKDLVDVRDGTHDSPTYVESGFPLVTSKNLVDGNLDLTDTRLITKEDYDQINKRSKVDVGDVLYSMIGSIGNRCLVKEEPQFAIKNVALFKFKNERLYNEYFYYLLGSEIVNRQIEREQRGGTQKFVSLTMLRNLEIPLPSLSEQKAIVAKLDRAQRLIDIDKEMLAKYDKLIQSVFLEMFGDPKSNSKKIKTGKLGDYVFINMGQSPKGSSYNEEGDGEPLLNGPTEFGEKYPIEKQWTTEPKKFAEVDDILFCVRGATAGRTNLADKKYCIGRGIAAIRGEEKLDTTFIHFVLKSHYDYFQNQGQGSTFINIAKKDLSNLEMPIPTMELQNEFVSVSKQIENQKQTTKGSLKKSKELFSALVQGAFTQ